MADRAQLIISASYRTDIPAFYGEWFLERFRAGSCKVVNPYNGTLYDVSLRTSDVDGFVFWTRNAQPFLPALREVARRGDPFVVQYTITGYPRELESRVIDAAPAIETARRIAEEYGPHAVVWRYDPVLLSSLTPPEFHLANFKRIARGLAGAVNEVVISFAQIYRKTERNLNRAASEAGFTWLDPSAKVKHGLARELAACAGANGMELTVCSQPEFTAAGIGEARCVDAARLSRIAGRSIAAKIKGNRPACACYESRDIGDYDTCPHGCVYCYAVRDREVALRSWKSHDPASETLAGRDR